MKDYLKKYGFGLLLYGLLGVALGFSGVDVVQKPLEFLVILGLVLAIDITAFKQGMKVGMKVYD